MFRRLIAPAMLPSFGINIGNKQRKRLEAAGKFPKRVWCSARKHAYVEDEIIAYGEERIRQRDLLSELRPHIPQRLQSRPDGKQLRAAILQTPPNP
jgi:hypothetical protein